MTAVDLRQLQGELTAAGVAVPNGLATLDDTLETVRTINAAGALVPLPPAAAAVLAAHVAPPIPAKANYGSDATDIDRQAAQAATQLRAFIANGSPTNAEVVAAVKLNARAILALMRRAGL